VLKKFITIGKRNSRYFYILINKYIDSNILYIYYYIEKVFYSYYISFIVRDNIIVIFYNKLQILVATSPN